MGLKYCTNCWTPETRPRITFNSETGKCNACEWADEKKDINWEERQKYFGELCDKYRGNGTEPDCIVPFSGGKDSIYVANKMKEFGMTPLLVCVVPHLETEIGKWNRENTCNGMKRLYVNLKDEKYRTLAKKYFIEEGRPKHPWECAISAVVLQQAVKLGIPFVIYGEEGEAEYGGVTREKDRWMKPVDKEYLMSYYYHDKLDWPLPDDVEFDKLFFTQWSRFENWSPDTHAHLAVMSGMRTRGVRNVGTFASTAQLSDDLQDLHAYLMFIKFGFGRCTSDVSIAIREGWMDREEGLELIEAYDGEFPNLLLPKYLEYFNMTRSEFVKVLEKHANPALMDQVQFSGCEHSFYLKPWLAKLRRMGTKSSMISPERFDIHPHK